MEIINVLVFPCGTEIGLELHAALKYEKIVRLFGASSVEDHGRMVFKNYNGNVPYIHDPLFLDHFNDILKNNDIDYIIPAHDSVLLYLTENREKLSAQLVAPEADICRLCRSKSQTYKALAEHPFIPSYYEDVDKITEFPVFLKPDASQGSEGISLAHTKEECATKIAKDPRLIMCEYLPGREYTVDCYSNKAGELLFYGHRERIRTKSGISMHSKSCSNTDEIQQIAQAINKALPITGPWFFQVKEAKNGSLKLLEIAPRIAGTSATHRATGINFALMSLFEAQGHSVAVLRGSREVTLERALINRYMLSIDYSSVFLDLDDTLIVHNKLNQNALLYLYQCAQKDIPVFLITRHFQEPLLTLEKFKIAKSLFEKIIWITDETPKSTFVSKEANPIFIDDSYKERVDVASTGATVFSPDAIEALLDWRA